MVLGNKFFVTPSDSVAIIAANAQEAIPYFRDGPKVQKLYFIIFVLDTNNLPGHFKVDGCQILFSGASTFDANKWCS